MIEIFFYSYLVSLHIYICGYLFFYIIIDKKFNERSNIFELFFYGSFILSFTALFLNFFVSLSKFINTILFFLPFIFILFKLNKYLIKRIIISSFPISLLLMLTLSYDGTYRPDAGSYHLPYISILNENKILIGINNIHFRFGHTSIIQYFSAIYNNIIFDEVGITIPNGLIFCNFVGYCIYEIFNKKNKNIVKTFIFLFLSFVLFRVNRYSDFGNDAPANILFFYLIIESLKDNNFILKLKKIIFASTFIFLNKVTLLIAFLIPIFYIFKNFKFKKLINKITIFSVLFLFCYTAKNILISGCLIFPVEQTCVKQLFWYDKESDRASNAINARLENESWTKGWMDQKGERKIYSNYLKNFNWVKSWLHSEGKKILKKLTPFFLYLFILFIIVIVFEKRNNKLESRHTKLSYHYYLCLIVSFLGSVLWFLKFPVFRYGYGYLISLLIVISIIKIKNYKILFADEILLKSFKYLIIFLILGVSLKNINRISKGIKNKSDPWPNIYSSNITNKKKENLKIIKNEDIIFYKSKKGECYYSKSPCTHFFNGNDFSLAEINIKNYKGYKVYYFTK
tara:strand:+ start:446 stop:2152 length:1707 start_codon:yes stop_codon:yes gene_type:complete